MNHDINKQDRMSTIRKTLIDTGRLAIDIGCGGVGHTIFDTLYRKSGFQRVIGIDAFGPNIVARQEQYRDYPKFSFVHAKAEEYEYPQGTDLVTLFHVAEHLSVIALEHLLKTLIASGPSQIFIETPDQFEDGSEVAAKQQNEFQRHKSLVTEEWLSQFKFRKVYTYHQGDSYFNSGYVWGV